MTSDDGHVLLASEMGCLQFAEENITHKWRLQPGKMLLIDLEQKRIISDEELKKQLCDRTSLQGLAEAHPGRAARPARRQDAARPQSPCRCSTASRPSATRRKT